MAEELTFAEVNNDNKSQVDERPEMVWAVSESHPLYRFTERVYENHKEGDKTQQAKLDPEVKEAVVTVYGFNI